jgi:multiple sugar transport system substrate-binding protein
MLQKITSLIFVFSALIFIGQGCVGGGGSSTQINDSVTLRYWRVFDGPETFQPIIQAYRAQQPNIQIEYRRLRFDEYEQELIRAFAEGRGPDIFTIHNTEVNAYRSLIQPMPSQITVTAREQRNRFSSDVVIVPRTKPTISIRQYKNDYLDQVIRDTIIPVQTPTGQQEQIIGIPLSVDTMVLYYNRDLLNSAGIAQPATNWNEFQEHVLRLTNYNADGNITQPGAAIGTADNIERSVDLLSLIMMQAGTQMINERGQVSFAETTSIDGQRQSPALNALTFYTDFSNPIKETFTWNNSQPNSLQAFVNGQVAYFFGYSYHDSIIRSSAPRLRYAVTKMPQLPGAREVNFANYWIEVVANNTQNANWAWDFLLFAQSQEQVPRFLAAARKPTARKGLIGTQIDDEFLGVFAEQLLTARHWYQGRDVDAMEEAMRNLIRSFVNGTSDPLRTLDFAARAVAQTY